MLVASLVVASAAYTGPASRLPRPNNLSTRGQMRSAAARLDVSMPAPPGFVWAEDVDSEPWGGAQQAYLYITTLPFS